MLLALRLQYNTTCLACGNDHLMVLVKAHACPALPPPLAGESLRPPPGGPRAGGAAAGACLPYSSMCACVLQITLPVRACGRQLPTLRAGRQ